MLRSGASDDEILQAVTELDLEKVLQGRSTKSASEKISDLFGKMSKEQKIAALKALKEEV
jgi:hypothetical protein